MWLACLAAKQPTICQSLNLVLLYWLWAWGGGRINARPRTMFPWVSVSINGLLTCWLPLNVGWFDHLKSVILHLYSWRPTAVATFPWPGQLSFICNSVHATVAVVIGVTMLCLPVCDRYQQAWMERQVLFLTALGIERQIWVSSI